MKRLLAGVVGGAAALSVVFGAGVASADNEWVGMTYEKVVEGLGSEPIIISRVGNYLPTEKCIVTGNRRTSWNGQNRSVVYLNCNDPMTAGHPGYSAASKQGEKAQSYKRNAARLSDDYAKAVEAGKTPICGQGDDYARYCINICRDSGECSEELVDFLGL